ncbi:hypothetical protein B296_00007825 [Ensete ventricosum]|uniref:Uncharacterized protein n=1 Tax=Ensete ventricosum TaxID=4639 RepID=A0A427B362_ENSVE|nr:hypothetical protein B296_00007825 [Ensete ventricosum]
MEAIVPFLVTPLDQIGRPEEPLLSNLEENLHSSRVKRDRWWPWYWQFRPVNPSPLGSRGLSSGLFCMGALLIVLLPDYEGLDSYVRLRYGLILSGKGQNGLHLLGDRLRGRLRGYYYGHKLRNVQDDGLQHSDLCLDLVGEAKEGLNNDD